MFASGSYRVRHPVLDRWKTGSQGTIEHVESVEGATKHYQRDWK